MPSMSFLEHLEELRTRIFHSVVAIAIGMLGSWFIRERLVTFMTKPIIEVLKRDGQPEKLVYLNPTEPFNLYLKICALAGLFITSPYVLYQVWLFISPGLYRKEKKYVVPFMSATVFLFGAGAFFGYYWVLPGAIKVLILDFGKNFNHMITIDDYTGFFLSVILGLGICFELPILIFFLALFDIVDAKFLLRHFRYAVLVIFVVAAIICPMPDPFSMCLFASPMLALYFIGVGIAYYFDRARKKTKAATA